MQLLGLTFMLYVNYKLMHIRTLRGPLFQGSSSSEIKHSKLVPRAPFPLKFWKGEKSHGREKVKCKQTNKQRIKIKGI